MAMDSFYKAIELIYFVLQRKLLYFLPTIKDIVLYLDQHLFN